MDVNVGFDSLTMGDLWGMVIVDGYDGLVINDEAIIESLIVVKHEKKHTICKGIAGRYI